MNRPAAQATTRHESPSDLLERVLDMPITERHRAIDAALTSRVPKIEELLPDFMKGQGERLVKRAMLTFARNPDLQSCPPQEFVRCVLEAAEMGFSIDGKLCYVVKYKTRWQCQLDYKGLVAVAKRMKTIADAHADVVCENDTFHHEKTDGKCVLDHTYDLRIDRGDVIGAYAIITLPSGLWRYELMSRKELDKIQSAAPAKNGPWSTHDNEMRKKTVLRRGLKTYCDDPGLIHILDMTDELEDAGETPVGRIQRAAPVALRRTPEQSGEPEDDGFAFAQCQAEFAGCESKEQVAETLNRWSQLTPTNEIQAEVDKLAEEAHGRFKTK